jgi:putative membrane protein
MSKNTFSGAILFTGACALVALVMAAGASNAQNANSNTNGGGHTGGGHGGGQGVGAGQTPDARFVMFAVMGSTAEIEMGRLAVQKGASEDVRQFGQRMIDDHTRANEELTRLASTKGVVPPATLDAKHQAAMRKMAALSGEKFDREYARMMVGDHKKTVSEFQKEADRGADPDLKAFAAAQLPGLREHLRMAQRLSDKIALRRSGHLKSTNDNSNSGGSTNANSNANNSNR